MMDRQPPGWLRIRQPISSVTSILLGVACVAVCLGIWWWLTYGEIPEERLISPTILPSPSETMETFRSLWFDRALTRNTLVTLKRVALGFSLALAVGIPFGVLAGCFAPIRAFLAPLTLFGRNIPLAALIGLTYSFFGIEDLQKVMFIFIACVAFVTSDTAAAISEVGQEYIDTAYTLGANRRQVVMKVLVPLAMPTVFDSMRTLFGLAFGYIMLAEMVRLGNEEGGLGNLINVSIKRGPRGHIFLILLIIPIVALLIDRLLYRIQRELFPHRFGGSGILNMMLRGVLRGWESLTGRIFPPRPPFDALVSRDAGEAGAAADPAAAARDERSAER